MKASAFGGIGAAVLVLLAAHASAQPSGTDSLYARIGGEPAMHAIVEEFAETVWTDRQIAPFFKGVTKYKFKKHLEQQFCTLTGGGCVYEGEGMREVHAGLHIRQGDFYRVVEVLRTVLERQRVAIRERNEFLAILAPLKRDVVEKPQ